MLSMLGVMLQATMVVLEWCWQCVMVTGMLIGR